MAQAVKHQFSRAVFDSAQKSLEENPELGKRPVRELLMHLGVDVGVLVAGAGDGAVGRRNNSSESYVNAMTLICNVALLQLVEIAKTSGADEQTVQTVDMALGYVGREYSFDHAGNVMEKAPASGISPTSDAPLSLLLCAMAEDFVSMKDALSLMEAATRDMRELREAKLAHWSKAAMEIKRLIGRLTNEYEALLRPEYGGPSGRDAAAQMLQLLGEI